MYAPLVNGGVCVGVLVSFETAVAARGAVRIAVAVHIALGIQQLHLASTQFIISAFIFHGLPAPKSARMCVEQCQWGHE